MKKSLILIAILMSSQTFAFESSNNKDKDTQATVTEEKKSKGISSSSGSLYTEVECDMSDYTCYRIILDLGRQEAIAHIIDGGDVGHRTTLLNQAIEAYRKVNPAAEVMSDEEVIYLLATSK